ncbi:MAG: metal ABC transporter permease [Anaerolineae bacterium]|nr:metal ABC transporter permease [Anaerolineae bacterium]
MNEFLGLLFAPLSYPFMVRGLVAALIVGIVCAVLGTYVVLRGMAFLGDALAHAILPGLAIGYLVEGGARPSLFWWALGTGVLTSLGIGAITSRGQVKEDTAIGVVFAGMFALGIALISTVRSYSVDLAHFLFGNVLGVAPQDLALISIFGGGVLLLVALFYKEFMVISFDPLLAATLRMPTKFLHYLLMLMLAATIVISLQTVGVALMMAMLVTPAATAFMLTRRLFPMMVVSASIGAFSAVSGLYLSYYVNVASGAAIVLICTFIFGIVFGIKTLKGSAQVKLH